MEAIMKNPISYCPTCKKVHGNPTVELFNTFMEHCELTQAHEAFQMDLYRAYVAGQHDCLSIMIRISDYPDKIADRLLNQVAAAIRDATIAGIDPHNEDLIAQVRAAVSKRFGIPQNGCASVPNLERN